MFELNLPNGNIFQIEADAFTEGAFYIRIWNQDRNHVYSELHLVPLWHKAPEDFEEGDYYQKTFASNPKRQGHGITLLNLLLENLEQIPNFNNIYSTSWLAANNYDDTDMISNDAIAFWNRLVENERAERIEEIARYRLLQ